MDPRVWRRWAHAKQSLTHKDTQNAQPRALVQPCPDHGLCDYSGVVCLPRQLWRVTDPDCVRIWLGAGGTQSGHRDPDSGPGLGQLFYGAPTETVGYWKAILPGARFYATGLVLLSTAVTPKAHQLHKILSGFGIAGTGFGVVLAVTGRASSDENRSISLAIVTAAGRFRASGGVDGWMI